MSTEIRNRRSGAGSAFPALPFMYLRDSSKSSSAVKAFAGFFNLPNRFSAEAEFAPAFTIDDLHYRDFLEPQRGLFRGMIGGGCANGLLGGPKKMKANEKEKSADDAANSRAVLVVDDLESMRSLVKEFLAPEGYAVLSARNGQDCYRTFRCPE